jgi:anti-sigma regulatory factor (Ser/Thr protein kinase)
VSAVRLTEPGPQEAPFRHEALLYATQVEFVEGTLDFIAGGMVADEKMLVVLSAAKIDLLRKGLGREADRVRFADMGKIGANPARIIAAWRDFADDCTAESRPFRGIGEPIWAGRTPEELVECQRHEALLNLAFAGTAAFRLLCPYDTHALGPDVLAEAHRSHPVIMEGGRDRASDNYRQLDEVAAPFDWPLPEPTELLDEFRFETGALGLVRNTVVRHAREAGFAPAKIDDLVVAVNEVVTNSLVHGGGWGSLRVWHQGADLVCEVRDGGRIQDPLVGRIHPAEAKEGGRGVWLATQLADLIQVRCYPTGSVVRLHMHPR